MCRSPVLLCLLLWSGPLALWSAEEILLRVERVVDGNHDLYVSLRQTEGSEAATWIGFATTPTWNKGSHVLALGELQWQAGLPTGRLGVTLKPDAWVPKDGTEMAGTLDLAMQAGPDGGLSGTAAWEVAGQPGSRHGVQGQRHQAEPASRIQLLRLFLPQAVAWPQPGRGRAAELRACLIDGRAEQVILRGPHMPTWSPWVTVPERVELQLQDGRLTGSLLMRVDESLPMHRLTLSGVLVDGQLRGWCSRQVGGKTTDDALLGSVERLTAASIDPGEADWELAIVPTVRESADEEASVPPGILLWLASRDSAVVGGYAITPTVSRATHAVAVEDLHLKGDELHGRLTIHHTATTWGEATAAQEMAVHMQLRAGGVTGRVLDDDGESVGEIRGILRPKVEEGAEMFYYIQCEDALSADSYWQSRCFLGFDLAGDGMATARFFRSDHPKQSKWTAELTTVEMSCQADALRGSLTAQVESSGPNAPGAYRFEFDGMRIGSTVGGTFASYHADENIKQGRFFGLAYPADWSNAVAPKPFLPPNKPTD